MIFKDEQYDPNELTQRRLDFQDDLFVNFGPKMIQVWGSPDFDTFSFDALKWLQQTNEWFSVIVRSFSLSEEAFSDQKVEMDQLFSMLEARCSKVHPELAERMKYELLNTSMPFHSESAFKWCFNKVGPLPSFVPFQSEHPLIHSIYMNNSFATKMILSSMDPQDFDAGRSMIRSLSWDQWAKILTDGSLSGYQQAWVNQGSVTRRWWQNLVEKDILWDSLVNIKPVSPVLSIEQGLSEHKNLPHIQDVFESELLMSLIKCVDSMHQKSHRESEHLNTLAAIRDEAAHGYTIHRDLVVSALYLESNSPSVELQQLFPLTEDEKEWILQVRLTLGAHKNAGETFIQEWGLGVGSGQAIPIFLTSPLIHSHLASSTDRAYFFEVLSQNQEAIQLWSESKKINLLDLWFEAQIKSLDKTSKTWHFHINSFKGIEAGLSRMEELFPEWTLDRTSWVERLKKCSLFQVEIQPQSKEEKEDLKGMVDWDNKINQWAGLAIIKPKTKTRF